MSRGFTELTLCVVMLGIGGALLSTAWGVKIPTREEMIAKTANIPSPRVRVRRSSDDLPPHSELTTPSSTIRVPLPVPPGSKGLGDVHGEIGADGSYREVWPVAPVVAERSTKGTRFWIPPGPDTDLVADDGFNYGWVEVTVPRSRRSPGAVAYLNP
uniref:hypothetical protein n=1 Tax=Methylobacterium sp. B34 TaxID=95563 RepID=UPI000344FAB5|nr:hypothetical protein [Methylobacterium sp. B34]